MHAKASWIPILFHIKLLLLLLFFLFSFRWYSYSSSSFYYSSFYCSFFAGTLCYDGKHFSVSFHRFYFPSFILNSFVSYQWTWLVQQTDVSNQVNCIWMCTIYKILFQVLSKNDKKKYFVNWFFLIFFFFEIL